MVWKNTHYHQEQSHYPPQGAERRQYEHYGDEEMQYEERSRGRPGARPSSNSGGYRSARPPNLPPHSGQIGESPGRPGPLMGGSRDPRCNNGIWTSFSQGAKSVGSLFSSISDNRRDGHRDNRREQYRAQSAPRSDAPRDLSIKELMHDNQILQESKMKLEGHMQKLDSECSRLKNRVEAMQSARDAQESRLGRQEQDDSIKEQVANVFQPIKKWTTNFCRDALQPVDVTGISSSFTPLIQRVIPSIHSLEGLPTFLSGSNMKRRKMFVRGWIAFNVTRVLSDPRQLDSESDLWLPKMQRDAVKSLETVFISSDEEIDQSSYHEWRTLTLALLDKRFHSCPWTQDTMETLDGIMQTTLEVIRPLGSPTADMAELKRTLLQNVFVPAVELSQVLRRQRAYWSVQFPHVMATKDLLSDEHTQPYIFKPDQMADIDSSDEEADTRGQCLKSVDIIILPGLYKCGDNDGERYEIESVVEKAQVSCEDIEVETLCERHDGSVDLKDGSGF
ncbi:hypothetical protein FSOLCH5_011745 [Fusarium solani]|uniref:uncharacterized protein n=1 Tax=Fusarium solani TaxID=169388 RepID=UPI0032C41021|nr:hypothetical protein MRS44_014300 [Fusarium solani]